MSQFNMSLTQVETYLNELKGEQSILGLYRAGKQDVITDFRELFLGTKLAGVNNLDRCISDVGKRGSSKGIAVEGQKGTGKSTLLSTLLLYHYLHGNIDAIKYLRYNSGTKTFEEIFNVARDEPKSRVDVVDDVHYFHPDLLTGRIVPFTRMFENITKDYATAERALFVYVSDSTPIDSLQYLYDGILTIGRRSDLLKKMPWVRDVWKLSNSGVVKVDREFYGKTYALLQGDVDLYNTANLFGEMIGEDTGLLANNPRLLKPIIKRVSQEDVPKQLASESELGKSMLRTAYLDKSHIVSHFHQRWDEKNDEMEKTIEWGDVSIQYALQNAYNRFKKFRDYFSILYDNKPMKALERSLETFRSDENKFNDDIKPLLDAQSRLDAHRIWLERFIQNYEFYDRITPEDLIKYKETYIRTREAASNFASRNPFMFTIDKNAAELLADPKKALQVIIQKRLEKGMPVS